MDIPVLIQPVPGKGFVARAGSPFDWSAEGATADEALKNLHALAMKCVAGGCVVASIDVPDLDDPLALAKAKGMVIEPPESKHPNPLMKWAGTLPDDELTAMFIAAVEEHRRNIDNDPDVL